MASTNLATLSDRLVEVYGVKETEANWQEMDDIIREMKGLVSTIEPSAMCEILWRIQTPLVSALQTERTRLALSAMDLVLSAHNLVTDKFEALYDVYLNAIFKLAERTNKIFHSRAQTVLISTVTNDPILGCKYYMSKIADSLSSPNKILRGCAAEMLLAMVLKQKERACKEYSNAILELTQRLLCDAIPNVRQAGRMIFKELDEQERNMLIEKLPPNVLKSLGMSSGVNKPEPLDLKNLIFCPVQAFQASSNQQSIPNSIPSSTAQSIKDTPIKGMFVDLCKKAEKMAILSHQSSFSRIPIGPAQRSNPSGSFSNQSANTISKNAKRVIKGVFEECLDDNVLLNKIALNDIKVPDKLILFDLNSKKEWNKRVEYLELVRSQSVLWARMHSNKLWENALAAIIDIHFRVCEVGLRLSIDLLSNPIIDKERCIEDLLVRTANALLTHRSRKGVVEASQSLLDTLHSSINVEKLLIHTYPSIMSRLDVLGSVKLRSQLLRLLEEAVKKAMLLTSRQILAQSLRTLVQKLSQGLTDNDQAISQSTRALFLLIIGAVGRRQFESELMPNVRSHSSRALLSALIDANPSLLPRSPAKHLAIGDDLEVSINPSIPFTLLPPADAGRAYASPGKQMASAIEELTEKLSRTPIK